MPSGSRHGSRCARLSLILFTLALCWPACTPTRDRQEQAANKPDTTLTTAPTATSATDASTATSVVATADTLTAVAPVPAETKAVKAEPVTNTAKPASISAASPTTDAKRPKMVSAAIIDEPTPAAATVSTNLNAANCAQLRKKATRLTNPADLYQLGRCYQIGMVGKGGNPREAYAYFEKAVAQGHPASHYETGRAMLQDTGSGRNPKEALRRLEVAAEAGLPEAQWLLGSTLMTGTPDVPRDRTKAKQLLKQYKERTATVQ